MMHGISKFTKLIWWSGKLFKSVRAIIDDVYFAMANFKKQPRSNFIATLRVQQSLKAAASSQLNYPAIRGQVLPTGVGGKCPLAHAYGRPCVCHRITPVKGANLTLQLESILTGR